ncbi:MAG: DUF4124 domain-containing protein, partial [Gammaproteobacteria bacterium]
LFLAAGLAQAQWMWVDERGVKQFSDMPPPASIPAKNILKRPAGSQPASAEPAAATAAPASAPASTLAEREADYRKRKEEQADKDKKAAEQARKQAEVKRNCDLARAAQAQLATGRRLATVAPNGERVVMGDEERAKASANANKTLSQCK